MRTRKLTIASLIAVPLLGLGWYAFRPELAFINASVKESAPTTTGQNIVHLAEGSFTGYAHQTTGTAHVLQTGAAQALRLENLNTSNGPDVHVYLVKGNDPKGINDGTFIDLGTLKGNIGDQNYAIPAGTNLSEYGAVSIWCKRFSVNFGGAALTMKTARAQVTNGQSLTWGQATTVGAEIKVTSGAFKGAAKGAAALVERDGKRFARISGFKSPTDVEAYLVKAETFPMTENPMQREYVRLGLIKVGGKGGEYALSKEIDIWLYRTVVLWNPASKKTVGVAELRSDQERRKTTFLI
jgi:hypothetical protein